MITKMHFWRVKRLKIRSEEFDFDELERQLEEGLEDSLSELKFLEEDKEKISNPENLGNAVMGVVWDQFVIQIGTVAGEDFIKENRGYVLICVMKRIFKQQKTLLMERLHRIIQK